MKTGVFPHPLVSEIFYEPNLCNPDTPHPLGASDASSSQNILSFHRKFVGIRNVPPERSLRQTVVLQRPLPPLFNQQQHPAAQAQDKNHRYIAVCTQKHTFHPFQCSRHLMVSGFHRIPCPSFITCTAISRRPRSGDPSRPACAAWQMESQMSCLRAVLKSQLAPGRSAWSSSAGWEAN